MLRVPWIAAVKTLAQNSTSDNLFVVVVVVVVVVAVVVFSRKHFLISLLISSVKSLSSM